jgi:hypothetical protein
LYRDQIFIYILFAVQKEKKKPLSLAAAFSTAASPTAAPPKSSPTTAPVLRPPLHRPSWWCCVNRSHAETIWVEEDNRFHD